MALVGAYVIGSVPTGFVLARLFGVRDIRLHGSGNIGATNVARVLGKKFFVIVLLLDAGKSYGYLALLASTGASIELLCGIALALLVGNSASLFLQFSGGKGVATMVGALLFFSPSMCLCVFVVWLCVFAWRRIVGLASVVMLLVVFVIKAVTFYMKNDPIAITHSIMAVWVIFLHRKNIKNF
jgi:glycerol-3-phosphate acyltransferase PlsY